MKRFQIIALFIISTLVMFAFKPNETSKESTKPANKVAYFESLGNDFAYISMELFKNREVIVFFDPTDDTGTLSLKGEWEDKGDNYQIRFLPNKYLDVDLMFEQNNESAKGVDVIDENTVEMSKHRMEIWIWGIKCARVDENKMPRLSVYDR